MYYSLSFTIWDMSETQLIVGLIIYSYDDDRLRGIVHSDALFNSSNQQWYSISLSNAHRMFQTRIESNP